jgi:hypothetical protein
MMANPFQLALLATRHWLAMSEVMLHSSTTIAARLAMINGALWLGQPWPAAEMIRMVAEKQEAALKSATLALRPYTRATRANAQRLTRRR